MIKGEVITVYNWFDIRDEICKRMGISKQDFRSYHKVVGGEYKDLWHVAIQTVIPDRMSNDTIVKMNMIEDYEGNEDYYCNIRKQRDEHREEQPWAAAFFEKYNEVMTELDPEVNGVHVKFSW